MSLNKELMELFIKETGNKPTYWHDGGTMHTLQYVDWLEDRALKLADALKPSHNSVRDAICAFSGQCQYQNNGTAKTCKLPEYVHGCSHRQHP